MTTPLNWTFFGWQGLTFEVPEAWDLSKADGNRLQGYVRLDDGELIRLEAKWERPKGKEPVAAILTRYLAALEKSARKKRTLARTRRGFNLAELDGKECECFSVRSDVQTLGLISRCEECRRVVLMRVAGRKLEPLEPIAKRIFRSMQDHSAGLERWGVYELDFSVPPDWRLERTFLRAGRMELLFSRGPDEMEIVRSGLAEMVLRSRTIEQWFRATNAKRIRGFAVGRPEETMVRGHKAQIHAGGLRAGRRMASLFLRRRYVHCYVWQCEASDKLLLLKVVSGDPKGEMARRLADNVACHRES